VLGVTLRDGPPISKQRPVSILSQTAAFAQTQKFQ